MPDEDSFDPLLSPSRQLLFKALSDRDELLAQMYLGAISLILVPENPDRFALAAHGFRELMEKIPRILDVPSGAERVDLKPKCRELLSEWRRAEKSKLNVDGRWQGKIDGRLRRFFKKITAFFLVFERDFPTRAEEARRAIGVLDKTTYALPKAKMLQIAEDWRKIETHFTKISHHKSLGSEEEYMLVVEELEQMLRDRMIPETLAEYDALDEIIRRGEGTA